MKFFGIQRFNVNNAITRVLWIFGIPLIKRTRYVLAIDTGGGG